MVLDHRFVPAGDEDEMFDARLACFIHHVLDQRPVHHRKHFLRHGLGRGQEAGAEAGDRKYGFADAGHAELLMFAGAVIRQSEQKAWRRARVQIGAAC